MLLLEPTQFSLPALELERLLLVQELVLPASVLVLLPSVLPPSVPQAFSALLPSSWLAWLLQELQAWLLAWPPPY